jgi:hypothetical protein
MKGYFLRFKRWSWVRAVVVLVSASLLLVGSLLLVIRDKTVAAFMQLFGAACLMIVALTHVSEALHLFPWMGWGLRNSAGHFLDLASAVLGILLFPTGYLVYAFDRKPR